MRQVRELRLTEEDWTGGSVLPPAFHGFVLVTSADLVQAGDELVEGLSVDDEAGHSFGVVGYDVGCPQVVAES